MFAGRAAGDAFEALQKPDPLGLMSGLDRHRQDLRPVLLEVFAEGLGLTVEQVGEKQAVELAGAILEFGFSGGVNSAIIASSRCICGFWRRGSEVEGPR